MLRQEIQNIVAIDQRGNDQNGRALGAAAIIKQPRRALAPHYRPRGAISAEAMAAIGFKSSQIALDAMRNLGLYRPFDGFSSESVNLGREVVQLPARDARG